MIAIVASFACACVACERPPSADQAKEWTPGDHDHSEEKTSQAQGAQAPAQRGDAGSGAEQLAEMTWQNNCFACHGSMGKGDGPSGPMVGAKDLTRADWQSTVSDADMAAAILGGKGRMPKFDLPEPVVKGLVARIRSMKGR
jgi:cytochrome c oxidase cbb3-type subunit 3